MKRTMPCFFLALLLLAAPCLALAGETVWQMGEDTYACVRWSDVADTGAAAFAPDGVDPARRIFVEPPCANGELPAAWVLLPEDAPPAETFFERGIRVTVGETWDTDDFLLVQPLEMEVVGTMAYGRVLYLDEAHIVLDLINGPEAMLLSSPYQYAVTEDTVVYPGIVVGENAELIFDEAERALWIRRANG